MILKTNNFLIEIYFVSSMWFWHKVDVDWFIRCTCFSYDSLDRSTEKRTEHSDSIWNSDRNRKTKTTTFDCNETPFISTACQIYSMMYTVQPFFLKIKMDHETTKNQTANIDFQAYQRLHFVIKLTHYPSHMCELFHIACVFFSFQLQTNSRVHGNNTSCCCNHWDEATIVWNSFNFFQTIDR